MIKKFLAIILCFSVLTAQAGEDFQGSLKGAFDELNYSMNVEWDQKDKEVQREIYIEFQQEMKRLVDAGLTQDDFLKFLETKIKDKKLLQDLKSTFEHISYSKLSPQQSAELIQTLMKKATPTVQVGMDMSYGKSCG